VVIAVINLMIPKIPKGGVLVDMGFGSRGNSMLSDSTSKRSDEPIQPIPISFHYFKVPLLRNIEVTSPYFL
jgi:hypothetical protein